MNKTAEQDRQQAVSRPPVTLLEAALGESIFRKKASGTPDENEPVPVRYGLGTVRVSERQFGVDFSLEFDDWKWADLHVTYRAVFEIPDDVAKERVTETMRRAAAAIGPIVLYPYVRQEIDGLLSRAHFKMQPLPVLNVGGMFDPEKLVVPEFQEEMELDGDEED